MTKKMALEKRKEALLSWAHQLKYKKIDKNLTLYDFFEYNGINLWEYCIVGICQELLNIEKNAKFSKARTFLKISVFPRIETVHDIFSFFFSKLFSKSYNAGNKDNPVILTSLDRDLRKSDDRTYDQFFDTIIEKLSKEGKPFLTIGENYSLQNLSLKPYYFIFKRRTEMPKIPHAALECFLTLKALREEKAARKHFKNMWTKLKESKNFKNIFKFRERDFFDDICPLFEYLFLVLLGRKIKLMEMSKELIQKTEPSVILIQNESSNWEQTLIYEAKKFNVKTIAIQHGVIYRTHIGYFHTKDSKGYPFTNLTAVYGNEIKKILVNQNYYPKDKVVITGSPRYDEMNKYFDRQIRENFFEKHKLDPNRKAFFIAASIIKATGEEFPTKTLELLKNFPDVQIVMKMHPSETNIEFYQKLIKKLGANVLLLGGKEDIFEAISACDFFGTLESTVALEAMMLKKPVFIFNFLNIVGTLPWIKEKAAININSIEKGKKIIEEVLKYPESLNQLMKNEEEFLEKYYYKLDGKATERIYNLFKKRN